MPVSIQKVFAIIGLSVAVIGLGLHLAAATTIKSDIRTIGPGETEVESLPVQTDFTNGHIFVYINVELVPCAPESGAVILVNASEYARFTQGTSFGDLLPLAIINGHVTGSNSTVFANITTLEPSQGPVYVVAWNKNPFDVQAYFSLSATSPLYEDGLLVTIWGAFVGVAALAWAFTGWKRYLLIGIDANLVAFLFRIALLPTYFTAVSAGFDFFHLELYGDFQMLYAH
ncbi:MAG TPA: hypothetical protein VKK79_23050, partial [Candidatus Lokiarchaeia archaeon]|nr:hypothetical protein [Candidatus Lokiarchaeia archaeon]